MWLKTLIIALINRLSANKYQCHYCHKWFDLDQRLGELHTKMPSDAKLGDYGDFLNYCSDRCHSESNSIEDIKKRFIEEI